MGNFVESDHPRNHPTGASRFGEKENSTPDATLPPMGDTMRTAAPRIDRAMNSELPEWAAVGKKVYARSRNGIAVVTIARVTATTVVDDRGNRYQIRTMSRSINDWDFVRLVSIDDPHAIRDRRTQISNYRAQAVVAAAQAFNGSRDEAAAAAVETAIEAWRVAAAGVAGSNSDAVGA